MFYEHIFIGKNFRIFCVPHACFIPSVLGGAEMGTENFHSFSPLLRIIKKKQLFGENPPKLRTLRTPSRSYSIASLNCFCLVKIN